MGGCRLVRDRLCTKLCVETVFGNPPAGCFDQRWVLPVIRVLGVHLSVPFSDTLALLVSKFNFVGSVTQGHQPAYDATDRNNQN